MVEKNSQSKKKIIEDSFLYSFLFITVFFISPLIFFTDLTRNPYYFQITILNISLIVIFFLLVLKLKFDLKFLTYGFANKQLLLVLLAFFLSSVYSYYFHNDFFKPAILSEFKRIWLFTLVNCVFPFYIAQFVDFNSTEDIPYWKYIIFIFLWGLGWALFPFLKSNSFSENLFFKFWDFYGFILWGSAIWFLLINFKTINHTLLLHLTMITSIIASIYGILQYFGIEFIWAKLVNPYGRRAVSTFGNPNFISSYVVMIIPVAIYYFVKTQKFVGRFFYSTVIISAIGMIFASLTRSSFLGLIASLIFIFSFKEYRSSFSLTNKKVRIIILSVFFLLLLWPDQNLKPLSFGVFSRMFEGLKATVSCISLELKEDEIYPSFHQRLLIWASAYNMFRENPILGKGWGAFELFYPYYQGDLIKKYPNIHSLRTHANNAHNEILEILSQTGIIGFGIVLLFFFSFVYRFLKDYNFLNYDDKIFIIAIFASLFGMIVDNMLNVSLHFAVPGFLFWWLVGILNKKFSPKVKLDFQQKISSFRKVGLIFLFIFSSAGVYYWYCQFMREVYYFEGFKLMRKNNFAEASKNLEKAYNYHSREVNNNYELANSYVRMNEYNKAIWAYGEALKSNSGYDEIFFNLGIIQKRVNNEKEALKNLKTSMFINPVNKTTFQALLEIYLKSPGFYADEAIKIIDEVIKVFPYESSLYNYAGYFLTIKKDYQKAKDYYEKGLSIAPLDNMLYENLKGVLNVLGIKNSEILDYASKCRELNEVLVSKPEEVIKRINLLPDKLKEKDFIIYIRAKAFFKMNELEKSKELLIKVLEKRKDLNDARYGLAVIYEKQGLFDEAKKQWLKILEYEPENKQVREKLEKM